MGACDGAAGCLAEERELGASLGDSLLGPAVSGMTRTGNPDVEWDAHAQ
jgi:hypothetical protein